MGLSQRPRGGSVPLAMDAAAAPISSRGKRRTIVTHLEGVVLDDMDALVSVHGKPLGPPPMQAPPVDRASYRRGSTSNCFSKKNPRRRRRRSTGNNTADHEGTGDHHESDEHEHHGDDDGDDTTFFVDDELVPVLTISMVNGEVGPNGRVPYGATNRQRRSTSAPLGSQPPTPSLTASGKQMRRHTDHAGKLKQTRRVTFKNAYEPEIMPDTRAPVQSYDELLFNVAGLYHTLSFLHDPDFFDDGAATDSSDSEHSASQGGPPPPPERSMQLMIAEFLYRSAVYLGYPSDDHVWVPGFREKKKFSSNDVTRWRRLAHFDWAAEERAFALDESDRYEADRDAHTQASARTSSRWTRISTRMSSRTTATYGRDSSTPGSSRGLRTTVSNWLHRGRSSSRDRSPTAAAAAAHMPFHQGKTSTFTSTRPLPKLLLDPPVVPSTTDLSLLVQVANACISYGAFRFTERQIRKLCNVPTRK